MSARCTPGGNKSPFGRAFGLPASRWFGTLFDRWFSVIQRLKEPPWDQEGFIYSLPRVDRQAHSQMGSFRMKIPGRVGPQSSSRGGELIIGGSLPPVCGNPVEGPPGIKGVSYTPSQGLFTGPQLNGVFLNEDSRSVWDPSLPSPQTVED